MDIKDILFGFLYEIAKKYKLDVNLEEPGSPIPTCVVPEDRNIFLNYTDIGKRKQAFQFAHELGHYLNGDQEHCDCDSAILDIKREYYADRTATKLILKGLSKNNIYFSNLYDLMEICAIPFNMVDCVNELITNQYPSLISQFN